jgi:hypothetical protein
MALNGIKAVEMVRHIRDRHHELLKNRTWKERTAFYETKAQAAMCRAEQLLREQGSKREAT